MRILFSIIFILFLSLPATLFAATDPWVVMARVARGQEGGAAAVDTTSVFSLAKSILVLAATGNDTKELVQKFLHTFIQSEQIGNPEYVHDDFWGILALRAGGVPMDHPALVGAKATILRAQDARGGWSWSALPDTPDTDDTAAAIMALLELGMPAADPALGRAFAYLRAAQNVDGGFPNVPPGVSSVDSTAWVAMALQKAGLDASHARTFLQAKIRDDGSWGSPATTSFAAIALAGKWFPIRRFDAAVSPSADTLRFRESQPVSAREPSVSAPQQPHSSSRLPSASDLAALSSKPPLSSAEGRSSASTPIVFPSLIATSVFSKPEKVVVVHTDVPLPIKKKEVIVKKITKKKNLKKNVKKKNHR